MDKLAYSLGIKLARAQYGLTKVSVPLWAFPAAAGVGALGGALADDNPWLGALKGGVLAPAALLGGAAGYKHGIGNTAKHFGKMNRTTRGALYGTAGAVGVGGATYGMGRYGLGPMDDMVKMVGAGRQQQQPQQRYQQQPQQRYQQQPQQPRQYAQR